MSHMKAAMVELTTHELIDSLERDEAEYIFDQFDPDGPYRYTGETDGWYRALKMMDPNEVRKHITEMWSEQ